MAFGLVATNFGLKRVSCFGTRISGKCQRQVSEELTWQPERGRRRPCRQRNRESEDGGKWGRPLGNQKKQKKQKKKKTCPQCLQSLEIFGFFCFYVFFVFCLFRPLWPILAYSAILWPIVALWWCENTARGKHCKTLQGKQCKTHGRTASFSDLILVMRNIHHQQLI